MCVHLCVYVREFEHLYVLKISFPREIRIFILKILLNEKRLLFNQICNIVFVYIINSLIKCLVKFFNDLKLIRYKTFDDNKSLFDLYSNLKLVGKTFLRQRLQKLICQQ